MNLHSFPNSTSSSLKCLKDGGDREELGNDLIVKNALGLVCAQFQFVVSVDSYGNNWNGTGYFFILFYLFIYFCNCNCNCFCFFFVLFFCFFLFGFVLFINFCINL
jgi:hypothetical protein